VRVCEIRERVYAWSYLGQVQLALERHEWHSGEAHNHQSATPVLRTLCYLSTTFADMCGLWYLLGTPRHSCSV